MPGSKRNAFLQKTDEWIERLAVVLICGFRRLFKNTSIKKIAILGPAPEGSLGDEALIETFINECRKRFAAVEITLFCWGFKDEWKNLSDIKKNYCLIDFIFRGSLLSKLRFLTSMCLYDHFVCIGADVLDGFYSEQASLGFYRTAQLMKKINLKAGIINFSFNRSPTEEIKAALKAISPDIYFIARDRKSMANMARFIQRPVALGCDLAFLLEPRQDKRSLDTVSWVKKRREAGDIILGVNINLHPFRNTALAGDIEQIESLYAGFINTVLADMPSLSVLLIPHDNRGKANDLKLCEGVARGLDAEHGERKNIISHTMSARGIKTVCQNLDFCFTGRFHLAIACLTQGVPAMALNYQDKLEGIYSELGVGELLVEPQFFLRTAEFKSYFSNNLNARQGFSGRIGRTLSMLKDRALVNFKYIKEEV